MSDDNLAVTQNVIPMSELIGNFVRVRDAIKEADDAHKAKMRPIRDLLDSLNAAILEGLQKAGGDSIKTENGTAFKTVKGSATIEDSAEFQRHVIGTESWSLVDWRANVPAVEDFILENKQLPPGIKYSQYTQANIRRS